MTPESERSTELRAGLFTLIGLTLIAGMVVYFGRLGEGFRSHYEINAQFPNAGGLVKGADVLMAGARIGRVNTAPRILTGGRGVEVRLKIYTGVEIPANSVFAIGSSGLLGDKFVDITPPPEGTEAPPLQPGATAIGQQGKGFGELAVQGERVLTDIREAVASINRVATRLDSDLLTSGTVSEAQKMISDARQAAEALKNLSLRLEDDLSAAATDLRQFLHTGNRTAARAETALAAGEQAAVEFRQFLRTARFGEGPINLLLTDREAAQNLRALLANLRARGLLFYRDTSPSRPPADPAKDQAN